MNSLPKASQLGSVLLVIAVVCALLSVAGTSVIPGNLACVNNAASLSLAVGQYVQDWDERFPPTSSVPVFQTVVSPYTSSHSVFICPVTQGNYKPNAAINNASLPSLGRDRSRIEVIRDGQLHADGLATVGYADGHAERSGIGPDPELACLHNAKQLALAFVQYVQDNDETLPPMHTPAEMQNAVLPYAASQTIFRSPVTGLPFTPNSALSGQSLGKLPPPSTTEIFRDPRRHRDGKLVIAYLDGHVVKQ